MDYCTVETKELAGSPLRPHSLKSEMSNGLLALEETIDQTKALLSASLKEGELQGVAAELRATQEEISSWAKALWKAHTFPETAANRLAAADRLFPGTYAAYRFLLINNSLRSLDELAQLPVDNSVKILMCKEYQFFTSADPDWLHLFKPTEYSYRAFTGISLSERFHAGLLDWEETGFPRSWFTKVPRKDLLVVFHYLLFRMGGLRPFWFPHNAFLRGKIQMMREREWEASLLLMAKSMKLQPQIKGILTGSWFYCPNTHRITPHLAWTTRIFLENGALMTNIGPADPKAGFLEGARGRQELYESGQYRPTETILLWPRENILHWLESHPRK